MLVCTTLRRLRLRRTDADVVLGGGVARARNPIFMQRLSERVAACAPLARISVVDEPPVVGAALLGLDRLAVYGRRRRSRARPADRIQIRA